MPIFSVFYWPPSYCADHVISGRGGVLLHGHVIGPYHVVRPTLLFTFSFVSSALSHAGGPVMAIRSGTVLVRRTM
jgi:hypothetical protein